MTTMELNAMRGELAREILNIESIELLQKVQRYIKRAVKVEKVLLIGADGMLGGELKERLEVSNEME